jgi:4-alpha-glucanotransferase
VTERLESSYTDTFGNHHQVPDSTLDRLRALLGEESPNAPLVVRPDEALPGGGEILLESGERIEAGEPTRRLPFGYHRLHTDGAERRLIVSPGWCHPPDRRRWGWSTQLYATRSRRSWGMGDLGDLAYLARRSRRMGAEVVLVNPLQAVSPTHPQQPSPYYPASRRFLNPIYLRVEDVPGADTAAEAVAAAARSGKALNATDLIDRDEVWRLKRDALEDIWSRVRPGAEFEEWRNRQGKALADFAAWSVLAERHGGDWRTWPADYAHPDSPAVTRLVEEDGGRLRFHQWLQWLTRRQFETAAAETTLVQDLPIGFDPGGADAWAWQDLLALDVSIGAPPDEFNTQGQKWGLPPFVPDRLSGAGYEPFIQTIRASITDGGGLRIDHILGLFRQFWIPEDASPAEGAYVRFPARELLDIVALESVRSGAIVIGEDLGTVPPGVREELAERRILSYRLLWFEETEPARWPELSMAAVTTHDLPTVAGLWTGADLAEQKALDMHPNEESTLRMRQRVARLAGLDESAGPSEAVESLHRRLAEAPSQLVCATLDDADRAARRPNLPGADAVRPNWRIPLSRPLEELLAAPLTLAVARTFDDGERDDQA